MEALIGLVVIGAIVVWLVLPFVTVAKVSGIAWELRELKEMIRKMKMAEGKPGNAVNAESKEAPKSQEEKGPAERRTKVATMLPPHKPVAGTPPPQHTPKPVDGTPPPQPAFEPTAFDVFWSRVEDWLAVRGEFAPAGMTREFAIATRWLVRIGTLILVGAIAYFMVLAIDKGWIGPVQRVYGMMAWGVAGTAFGTWLKMKSERYAIIGEVVVALGLVAAYLSFGLGHRYFRPPVIASGYVAFAGLFVATVAAGILSVRLRSLMIACLALVGGFLVPMICSFTNHDVQLHVYLCLLSLGACAVACFRGWTLFAFTAIAVSLVFSQMKCGSCAKCDVAASYLFHAIEVALTLAIAVRVSVRETNVKIRPFCWIPVVLAGIFCLCKMDVIIGSHFAWCGVRALNHLGWATAFAALAFLSRRRTWGGTPVLIVFSCACAAFALGTACIDWWHVNNATVALLFCLFAALLAEFGARSGERTLHVLALIATIVMSFISFGLFATVVGHGAGGYAHNLIDRIQYLWPVPALVAFVGWRIGGDDFWRPWLPLRTCAYVIAAGMAFFVLTVESHFFGREFLPFLRGGFVTIVWAIVASALLATGILRRVKAMRLWGLGLLAASVTKLLLFDTASLATPGRVGVFAAVGVLLIAGAFLYLKFKSLFEEERR